MVRTYTGTSRRRKNVTILWDFIVHPDKKIDANRPDIIIKNYEERTCIMMDVATPRVPKTLKI